MQRQLSIEILQLVDKQKILPLFLHFAEQTLTDEEINQYMQATTVMIPLDKLKRLISVEQCVDTCLLLCLHNYVNYVALAKKLMTILDKDMCICLNQEIEEAIQNAVQLCQTQKISVEVVQNIYDIFSSRKCFGPNRKLIALMVSEVFVINSSFGAIQDVQDGKLIISKVEKEEL